MIELIETVSPNQLLTTDVQELASELEAYQAIYSDCFGRREQREKYHIYLHGLLQDLPNKSIETMMLHNNGDDPNSIRAMQQFISQGAWDDEAVLAHFFLVHIQRRLHDKAPKLMLPQAILLLKAILPKPQFDLDATVEIVNYYQRRHEADYLSHRKRRLAQLEK